MFSLRSVKVSLSTLVTLVALGVAVWAVFQPQPAMAWPDRPVLGAEPTVTGTIRVSGSSAIKVQPDRVVIYFGIQSFAETPKASRSANAGLALQVKKAILAHGVAAKDIATDYYRIDTEYEDGWFSRKKIVGYWTNNTVAVTLRDVADLEMLLVDVLDIDNVTVEGINFSTSRLRELRDEARALAVQAALEKADAMAGVAGASLGDVTHISENGLGSRYYGYGRWRYAGGRDWSNYQNVVQDLGADESAGLVLEDGSISLGQIVVQAQVDLTVDLTR